MKILISYLWTYDLPYTAPYIMLLMGANTLPRQVGGGFGPWKSWLRIRIHFIRIRIQLQHFRLNTDPDPIRIQGFNDQKLKKKLLLKKN